ncbi:MAG: D-2-hydroxyacid dehydrogenase [Firmicutes bacterium]|nr:D-2-hydroxyacid dehydrogenase [Bacillota bacterium]
MKTVVLNQSVINYDGNIDFSKLSEEVDIYDITEEKDIVSRVQGAEIVVTKEMPVKGEIILQFPESVKLIVEAGTGYNNIDVKACQEKGILLCNIPAYSSQRVAQTAIMLMLNLASSMQVQLKMLDNKNYDNFHKHLMVDHFELNDKVLGCIGYGNIAKETIQIAKAMGMKVQVYTRTKREVEGIEFVDLDTLLKTSDVISIHCPLNEQTRHMIDAQALSKMKKSAMLINTSRGAIIDEKALIVALKNKEIFGAGLDVQEVEPLDIHSELFTLENAIVTPHIGWRGYETRQRLLSIIQQDIDAYRSGNPINRVI